MNKGNIGSSYHNFVAIRTDEMQKHFARWFSLSNEEMNLVPENDFEYVKSR